MSDKLLPCPFCNGDPIGPTKKGGSDERIGYNFTVSIACGNCGATLCTFSHKDRAGWCDDKGQAEASVRAAWNRRT
jgi:hypothetical protein